MVHFNKKKNAIIVEFKSKIEKIISVCSIKHTHARARVPLNMTQKKKSEHDDDAMSYSKNVMGHT